MTWPRLPRIHRQRVNGDADWSVCNRAVLDLQGTCDGSRGQRPDIWLSNGSGIIQTARSTACPREQQCVQEHPTADLPMQ